MRLTLPICLALLVVARPGLARDKGAGGPPDAPAHAADDDAGGASILDQIPALAGVAAARDGVAAKGLRIGALYLGDPYGTLSGGLKRGATFSGRLDVQVDLDAGTVFGLDGTRLHANLFQIHGHDLSLDDVGNLLSINDIAARPTTRLYELWIEHRFGDLVAVKAGQIGIDVEFLTSTYAATFVNASFGWPGLPTVNLPEGGPAYPLATPAVQIRLDPTPRLSILAAVFDGEPAGPGPGDPQARDRYGLNFRVTDPPLVFTEAQYRYDLGGPGVADKTAGLPGTVKLGAFSHFGRFDDQRLGTDGLSLASPASNGVPVSHSPDIGFYGIVDQAVYRASNSDTPSEIGVFARMIGSPGAQNAIDLYGDAGFTVSGMVPGRPADVLGAAVAYAGFSPAARAFDRDRNAVTGIAAPIRDFEAVLELSYVAQIVPGLNLQPDIQYVVHPGGHIASPGGHIASPGGDGGRAIPNALVVGVTTIVRF